MKFLFADESISHKHSFVIISGIYYDVEFFRDVEDNLCKICSEHDIKTLKKIKSSLFVRDVRNEVNQKVAATLSSFGSKIISSIVLRKEKQPKRKYRTSPYPDGVKLVAERFYRTLLKDDDVGIIFYDEDSSKGYLTKVLEAKEFIEFNNKIFLLTPPSFISPSDLNKKIRLFLFVNDKKCYSVQAADLIAGALQKAVNNLIDDRGETIINKLEDHVESLDEYFYGIRPYWCLFERSGTGRINGWGIKIWR